MQKTVLVIILPILLSSQLSSANDTAPALDWELGATLAALQIPLYPGSAANKQYLLPLPYAKLHSEFLDIDEGIYARLFRTTAVRLSLSADLGVPVNSDESRVRKGMADLDTVLQLGPLLEITLAGSRDQSRELRFELPARLAFATDFSEVSNLGWIYEPRFSVESRRVAKTGLAWQVTAGVRYASAAYHAYYYDVPTAFVTAERAQFTSVSGYGGGFADVIAAWREDTVIYWAFLRYQNLSGAVFENSALVEQNSYYFIGVGLSWVFAHSL